MYPQGIPNTFNILSQQPNMMPSHNLSGTFQVPVNTMPQSQFQTQMRLGPGMVYPPHGLPARPPPAYTPSMAQSFHDRQRQLSGGRPLEHQQVSSEERRARERERAKLKEYELQKMKLQSFTTTGTTKVDESKFIEHMFGKKEPQAAKTVAPEPTVNDSDSFGEFLGNTAIVKSSVDASTFNTNTPSSQIANPTPIVDGGRNNIVQQQAPKDLKVMMMECSDLSATSKAKTFHRPTLKEVQRTHSGDKSTLFHQSNASRDWKSATAGLDGVFVLDEPISPPSRPPSVAHRSPRLKTAPSTWLSSRENLPPVYNHVIEACMVDGRVSTERLYPILLMSGLTRDALGQVWMMVNKTTPGQLTPDELVKALALVALKQNKIEVTSLDILSRCPTAPVPLFNKPTANVAPTPQQYPQTQQQHQQQHQQHNLTVVHEQTRHTDSNDEFADFQSATFFHSTTPSQQPVVSSPVSNSTFHTQSNQSAIMVSTDENVYVPAEERHSNVSTFFCSDDSSSRHVNMAPKQNFKGSNSDDDFYDFKSAGSGRISSELSENEDFRALDTYVTTLNQSGELAGQFGYDTGSKQSFNTSSIQTSAGSRVSPATNLQQSVHADHVEFGDFSQYKTPPRNNDAFTDIGVKIDSSWKPFEKIEELNQGADMRGSLMGDESGLDKYSALKSIDSTQVTSLFDSPAKVDSVKLSQEAESTAQNDGWADFQASRLNQGQTNNFRFTHSHSEPEKLSAVSCNADDILNIFNTKKDGPTDLTIKSSSVGQSDWIASFDDIPQQKSAVKVDFSDTWGDFASACDSSKREKVTIESDVIKQAASKPPLAGMNVVLQANPLNEIKNEEPRQFLDTATKSKSISREVSGDHHDDDFDFTRGIPPPIDDIPHHDNDDDFGNFNAFHEPDSPLDAMSNNFSKLGVQQGNKYTSPYNNSYGSSTIPPLHADEPPSDLSPPSEKCKPIGFEIMDDIDVEVGDRSKAMQNNLQSSGSGFDFSENFTSSADADLRSIGSLDLPIAKNVSGVPDSKSLDSLDLKLDTFSASTPESKSLDSLDVGDDKLPSSGDDVEHSDHSSVAHVKTPAESLPRLTGNQPVVDNHTPVNNTKPGSDDYIGVWERCLGSCCGIISQANSIFNTISSSSVCNEVIRSVRGTDYISGLLEVYRVACRIMVSMETTRTHSEKLDSLHKDINTTWNNLAVFIVNCSAMSNEASTNYQTCVLASDDSSSQKKACGLCLLNVDAKLATIKDKLHKDRSKHGTNGVSKLSHAGRQYHATCANFWVNRVDCCLPSLRLPTLL